MSDRSNEGLQSLGRKTVYRDDYAPEVLETFIASVAHCMSEILKGLYEIPLS